MRDCDYHWLARIHHTTATGDQTHEIIIPPDVRQRLLADHLVERRHPPRGDGLPDPAAIPIIVCSPRGANHVTRPPLAAGGAW